MVGSSAVPSSSLIEPGEMTPEQNVRSAIHWPEYLMEAAGLGIFMFSACLFATLLEYSASPLRNAIENPVTRRALMGAAMGLTAIGIIYSPWGKQSGAHLNPSVTLAFFSLGRIRPWDAVFYWGAQFAGGASGVGLAVLLLGMVLSDRGVNYVVTLPGSLGSATAFLAETVISFVLMLLVLVVSNTRRLHRYTGLLAGTLVALYITVEAPLSGMSMNPARTLASAVWAQEWQALWIYFTAPFLGMLSATLVYRLGWGSQRVFCVKLHHQNSKRCIFHCNYKELEA